jgi:hypothetical protein
VSAEPCPVEIYQLHILLLEISPAIWRRVLVRSDSSVANLHYILQIVMGWEDAHLHRFLVHGKEYGVAKLGGVWFADDPQQVALHSLRSGTSGIGFWKSWKSCRPKKMTSPIIALRTVTFAKPYKCWDL